MNIVSIETKVIELKLLKPVTVALGVVTALPTLIVKIETSDGFTGYGECAPISFVTGETLASVEAVYESFKKNLISMDSSCIEQIHDKMNRLFLANTAAKTGIDIALFDIAAKRAGIPLYKYLGGAKSNFPVDKTISIGTDEEMVADALQVKKEGFGIVKVKLGLGVKSDITKIKLIREAIGSDMAIRIDANQGWSKLDAIKIINAIEQYDVEVIEQPLKYWDFDGHALVRDKVSIPLMADESLFSEFDAIKIIKSNAFDIFNIKLMKCAGLYNAIKINSIGQASGFECMLGCMLESNIGISAAASFIGAKSNVTKADIDSVLHIHQPPQITGGVQFKDGNAVLSDEPGLGININWEAL